MTDYRDPNYPNPRDQQVWSGVTWGWIAGIAVVVLILIFAFGGGRERTATDTSGPPATTGKQTVPVPPASGPKVDAPTTNRPVPTPATPPAPNSGER